MGCGGVWRGLNLEARLAFSFGTVSQGVCICAPCGLKFPFIASQLTSFTLERSQLNTWDSVRERFDFASHIDVNFVSVCVVGWGREGEAWGVEPACFLSRPCPSTR